MAAWAVEAEGVVAAIGEGFAVAVAVFIVVGIVGAVVAAVAVIGV